jgi:hypothetical protein
MNLNYILDTARKMGIPVVITNERGEAPQVVVPFEDFAAMVGGPSAAQRSRGHLHPHVHEENDEFSSLEDEEETGEWSADEEDASYDLSPEEIEELDKVFVEEESEDDKESTEPSPEPTSVSLEDQFYFEQTKE